MTREHIDDSAVDTDATRRQFLFAREQVWANVPGARMRIPQHRRGSGWPYYQSR